MKLLSAAAAISACLLMSGNIMAQNIQIKVDDKREFPAVSYSRRQEAR